MSADGRGRSASATWAVHPAAAIDLDTLVRRRVVMNPRLDRHLERACRVTGQKAIRFPEIWEDSATLAATAAHRLFGQNPGLELRTFATSPSARKRAWTIPSRCPRTSKACCSAPARLRAPSPASRSSTPARGAPWRCSAWPRCSPPEAAREYGIVVSSDVARYETESTAEITQGAGAVALHVTSAPRLARAGPGTAGLLLRGRG